MRARQKGLTPGYDGKPCFTRSDALEVLRCLPDWPSKHFSKTITDAMANALNQCVGKVDNPVKRAKAWARSKRLGCHILKLIDDLPGEIDKPAYGDHAKDDLPIEIDKPAYDEHGKDNEI